VLPLAAFARGSGDKVSLAPDTVVVENSQTMSLLTAHRNTDPTITAGPVLAIVDNSAIESEASDSGAFADQGVSGSGAISVYTVRDGDTLASIAKMFDVSVNTIRWANDISSDSVKPGTELVILPVSGVRHVVKLGDTLQSIAKKYNADLADVLSYNNISLDAKLSPGDVVIVPNGEVAGSASTPSTKKTGSAAYKRAANADAFEPLLVNVSKYPSYPGYYARPVAGGVKTQDLHGYNAVDIGDPYGSTVMASASGKVIIAKSSGYNGGYGSYIVISHSNGTQTLYAHLSRVNVTVGQTVLQGQTIGAIGTTGWSTGPHLHFEIRGAKNPF